MRAENFERFLVGVVGLICDGKTFNTLKKVDFSDSIIEVSI